MMPIADHTQSVAVRSAKNPRVSSKGTFHDRRALATSFYRAMHFSAKRGLSLAIACRPSVRLSVCLSVCL